MRVAGRMCLSTVVIGKGLVSSVSCAIIMLSAPEMDLSRGDEFMSTQVG